VERVELLICLNMGLVSSAVNAEHGAGSLAVGMVLVVLIPFLRKLITDKAETIPIDAATVVPVA
jgi:hypothetical protein